MMIRLSEAEFIDFLYKTPLGEFVEMDDVEYHQLLHKAETTLRWLRNARTLRPVLVSTSVLKEVA